MKTKNALIFWGGWDGHQPEKMASIFAEDLETNGFNVHSENSLLPLEDPSLLSGFDLIIPCWTMGTLTDTQGKNLQGAVLSGTGLAGTHGGMGDAFRGNLHYEWMVGGMFVGHPYCGEYTVRLTAECDPITNGMAQEFKYCSEQYYMLVDTGITVLAEALYTYENRRCVMPVVWKKTWGQGRVFYSALGHSPDEYYEYPHVREMHTRGFLWAARD